MIRQTKQRDTKNKRLELRRFGHGGFSLIEVVVAMSILTIGILAVVQMEIISQRNITSGNIITIATLLAHTEIERIRSSGDVTGLGNRFFTDPDPRDPFKVTYHFSDPHVDDYPQPLLANCETSLFNGSGSCLALVTVSWMRGGVGRGSFGSVTLKTMVHGGSS